MGLEINQDSGEIDLNQDFGSLNMQDLMEYGRYVRKKGEAAAQNGDQDSANVYAQYGQKAQEYYNQLRVNRAFKSKDPQKKFDIFGGKKNYNYEGAINYLTDRRKQNQDYKDWLVNMGMGPDYDVDKYEKEVIARRINKIKLLMQMKKQEEME